MPGRGKSGGVRLIYYWDMDVDHIVLLFLYPKNVRATPTPAERLTLRRLTADWLTRERGDMRKDLFEELVAIVQEMQEIRAV